MSPTDASLPAETAIGRVALRVGDLEAVREFYGAVVGLVVRSETADGIVLGTDEQPLIELIHAPELPPRARAETGLFHTAFRVPSRGALAEALDRLEDRWELSGASDHRVSEALYARDPADNGVEIYRDYPRDAWPLEPDGTIGIDTLPLALETLRGVGSGRGTVPPGTTVGHVHLEVSAIPQAREFYVDALGLDVKSAYGRDALFLAAGDYHHHVGVNVWNGRTAPAAGRGLAWFELLVPDGEALAAARERLSAAGFEPTCRDDGVQVTDPDGIGVRVTVDEGSD